MSLTTVDQDLAMGRSRGGLRIAISKARLSLTLEMDPMRQTPARGQSRLGSCIFDIKPGTIPCGEVPDGPHKSRS